VREGEDEADLEDEEQAENPEEEEEEDESGDDGVDHDELILGGVVDVVIGLARAMGNEFTPYFQQIAPHLVVYTNDNHPKSDRSMALGSIAEVFAACTALIPRFFNEYFALIEKNSNT